MPKDSRKDQVDYLGEAMRAIDFTEDEVADCEDYVRSNPSSAEHRAQLLGYYGTHQFCCKNSSAFRLPHLLWIVENRPEVDWVFTGFMGLFLDDTAENFEAIKAAWEKQLNVLPGSARVAGNFGTFLMRVDPARAFELLDRASKLEPSAIYWKDSASRVSKTAAEPLSKRELFQSMPWAPSRPCVHRISEQLEIILSDFLLRHDGHEESEILSELINLIRNIDRSMVSKFMMHGLNAISYPWTIEQVICGGLTGFLKDADLEDPIHIIRDDRKFKELWNDLIAKLSSDHSKSVRWQIQNSLEFDGLSNSAKEVLVLADQEARKLNCSTIGTAQLLLGLIAEPSGAAGRVLRRLGTDLDAVRLSTTQLDTPSESGILWVADLPYSRNADETLSRGWDEAEKCGHQNPSTEHLLLSLLQQDHCNALLVLKQQNINLNDLRRALLLEINGPDSASSLGASPPDPSRFNEPALKALLCAEDVVRDWKGRFVDTDHLLFGLIKEANSLSKTFENAGLTMVNVLSEIQAIRGENSRPELEKLPIAYTSNSKQVFDQATKAAGRAGRDIVQVSDLLRELISDSSYMSMRVLHNLNIDLSKLASGVS